MHTDWFAYGCLESFNKDEREFLHALRQSAADWTKIKPMQSQVYKFEDDILILGLDVDHPERNLIIHALRAEYTSGGVKMGIDETSQFATNLTADQKFYVEMPHKGLTPKDLACEVSAWFLLHYELLLRDRPPLK